MGFPTTEILGLVYQLLPGFIAAWIFYGLTAHPKKEPFERTVQALIFTGFVKAIVVPTKWSCLAFGQWNRGFTIGEWSPDGEYFLSVLVGVLVGFIFTYCANTNSFHDRLKWITKKTSYPSEWFSAFTTGAGYVYLHLKGERRIFGWTEEWPDTPTAGHFSLMQAEWILDDNTRVPLLLTEKILIPAQDVVMVEFQKSDKLLEQVDLVAHEEAAKILIDLQKKADTKPHKLEVKAEVEGKVDAT